ncbi:MAG: dihydrolipoyl dehydrogenase [Thermodesulfovibrionia bacterium]
MKIAILGAGPGGYVAAIRAAQLGADVTVIEETEVGGTCLNRGCIPTKTLIASADVLSKAKSAGDFGLQLNGSIEPDIQKIIERKDKVVSIQVKGIRGLFKSWGIRCIDGRGFMVSPKSIMVTTKDGSKEEVTADRVIIATGSRPANIPTFPFDGKNILSSDDALRIDNIPSSILIIGAGVIGCEFAFIFREFGSDVTMVEMLSHAVSTEDEEISSILERELKKRKIRLFTDVKVESVEIKDGGGVSARLSNGNIIEAEKVLVSIGRAINSDNIGIEDIGIKKGQRGEIIVDNRMQTNIEGVYAIGDVVGGLMLAHVASREGIVAAENAMGGNRQIDYGVVPSAIFANPEIASVGMRERDAIQKGIKVRIGRFQFRALGKAHAMGEIVGMIKLIADDETDRLLGAHIIGAHASDLIHEAAIAIKNGLTARDIAHTIHAHPTLSEGIMEASEDIHGNAIHVPKT